MIIQYFFSIFDFQGLFKKALSLLCFKLWPLGLCQEPNLYLLVGLDNGDVAHNINPDICFLTKAMWPKI